MASELGNPAQKQKQRNRVPVSCLICKRRKVKCDKVKPACGGCIKNGVPHLCEYVEPAWSNDNETSKPNVNRIKSESHVEQTENKKQQIQKDKLIHEQRKEIEELKRQLTVSQQLYPKVQSDERLELKVTILEKLNVNNVKSQSTIEVNNYATKRQLLLKQPYIDTYSWISIIKLDPHLTTLWFKITNLQKIYHLYKMNLINSKTKNEISDTNLSILNPLSKRSSYKINEIDFTHSLVPSSKDSNSYLKCPVVECDFNFMFEASPTPVPTTKSDVTESPDNNCSFHKGFEHISDIDRHNQISGDSKKFLKEIQSIWNSTLGLLRGNEIMNYFQINFLIDFYFHEGTCTESRNLLYFYKSELKTIIKKDGNAVSLNFVDDQYRSEEDCYFNLILKGLYLCILSLIIEESLEIIRIEANIGNINGVSHEFRSIFPSEVLYLGLGYKANNILFIVQEYLLHVSYDKIFNKKMSESLVYILCCMAFLNRQVSKYKNQGSVSDSKVRFQTIFTQLISTVFSKTGYLEVWKNPQDIMLTHNESEQRLKEFRLGMCYLWSDIIRLVNLATFNITHLIGHPEKVSDLIFKFYDKIVECEKYNNHIIFIYNQGSIQDKELGTMLSVNYLISRIYYNLRYGIVNVSEIKLTTNTLFKMIDECKSWKSDNNLHNNTMIRNLETRCIFHYLSLHLSYIIILQNEEEGHGTSFYMLHCEFFIQFCELILFIEVIIKHEPHSSGSQHVLLLVTEALTRTIHFVIGLLLKLGNTDDLRITSKLFKKLISIVDNKLLVGEIKNQDEEEVYETLHNRIVNVIDQTITSLVNSYITGKEKAIKLSKLWNFYLTFIKNSHKMSSLDYATIHANIPGFKSINSQNMAKCAVIPTQMKSNGLKKCPVKHEITTTHDKSGFSRCPISHITTPMDDDVDPVPSNPGKCPVDHEYLIDPQQSKKRKFPFEHKSPQHRGTLPNEYNTVESNIRSSAPKLKCPVRGMPKEISLPVINSNNSKMQGFDSITTNNGIIDNASNSLTSVDSDVIVPGVPKSEDTNSEFPNFGVNWQEFTDFDFEFMQNELMFKQVQDIQDNGLYNPSIEDLFR